MKIFNRLIGKPVMLLCALLLVSCGGDSGGGVSAYRDLVSGQDWSEGIYFPADNYQNSCETPTSEQREGSAYDEKMWLRSWTNDVYLWYDEVEDVDPLGYSVADYFNVLKTNATTASGRDKDRFHFYYEIDEWQQRQQGIISGYGIRWEFEVETPRLIVTIALVAAGSPADNQGLRRGDVVTEVDGVDTATVYDVESALDNLNAGLFPPEHGETHIFTVQSLSGETREVSLESAPVATQAVTASEVIETDGSSLGYVAFNNHNLVAQDALVESFQSFVDAGVEDVVLDLRYNGGGYLAVASQLAYMIAGEQQTEGKVFERVVFNDKHTETNPFTGSDLAPMPFNSKTIDFFGELPDGRDLPNLGLNRVVVITTGDTCSASESIMNSLRGIDVEVIQIGSTTCGKPYGFYGTENCQNIYFSINMKGENDKGFGDYADGFSPQNLPSTEPAGVSLEGCYAEDDLSRELGDPDEGMFAAAIKYLASGECDTAVLQKASAAAAQKTGDLPVLEGLEALRRVEGLKLYR